MQILKSFSVFTIIISLIGVPLISTITSYRAPSHPYPNIFIHAVLKCFGISNVHRNPTQFPFPPYAIFSTRVVIPGVNNPVPAYVHVNENGTIAGTSRAVLRIPSQFLSTIVDVSPFVVMPGLIDPHVHVNSPGNDHWEGFASASRAAAAGGTTTIFDMPINSVPATVDENSLALKIASLRAANASIDVGLIGGVIPSNTANLQPLLNNGVIALKSFLIDSQSPDFPKVTKDDLRKAINHLNNLYTRTPGERGPLDVAAPIPYILHAELDDEDYSTGIRATSQDTFDHASYAAFEATRPASWETNAVSTILSAVNGSKVHVHIAHVSTYQVVEQIRSARQNGLGGAKATAETCGHYVMFSIDDISPGATLYKCAPPIRSRRNKDNLLRDLFRQKYDRVIGLVASDHSPSPPNMKQTSGNMTSAWGGISGVQYRLGACCYAAKKAGAPLVSVYQLLSEGPAKIFGLDNVKGLLASGRDADIIIWDPDVEETVQAGKCQHRHKDSAFNGWQLPGQIKFTLLRGRPVFTYLSNGTQLFNEGHGRLLRRNLKGQVEAVVP